MSRPHFHSDGEFEGVSQLDRYEIFYRRLEQEGCYSAAAVIASSKEEGTAWGAYRNLSENTCFERFIPEFIALLVKPRATCTDMRSFRFQLGLPNGPST